MGILRILLGLVLGVIVVGAIYWVRDFGYMVADKFYKALGYEGFNWSLVPEPIRSLGIFVDEALLPNAFVLFMVAFVVTEFILWWRYTHEGTIVVYGGR